MAKKKDIGKIVMAAAAPQGERKVLSCAAAFKLAEAHGLTFSQIGRACDRKKIKIVKCQLGCFE